MLEWTTIRPRFVLDGVDVARFELALRQACAQGVGACQALARRNAAGQKRIGSRGCRWQGVVLIAALTLRTRCMNARCVLECGFSTLVNC